MPKESILRGQHVEPVKLERARALRREMTREERMLWGALRDNQAQGMHFRHQQVMAGLIFDFYCHAAKLCVEVDGGIHEEQQEYAAARDEVLSAHGIRVLRVSNASKRQDIASVIAEIKGLCAQPPRHPRQTLMMRPLPSKGRG